MQKERMHKYVVYKQAPLLLQLGCYELIYAIFVRALGYDDNLMWRHGRASI
jgi:hypothetical protein